VSSGRPTILHVRLSPEEIARLDSLRRGLSRSAYIRSLLPAEAEQADEQPVAPASKEPQARPTPSTTPRKIVAARPSQPGGQVTTGCRHPGKMRFGPIGNRTCRLCGTKGLG
jgi:hypothetical protein